MLKGCYCNRLDLTNSLQYHFSGERESTLKKIEVALAQTEFAMEKASRVHHMNQQECVLYEQLVKKIGLLLCFS